MHVGFWAVVFPLEDIPQGVVVPMGVERWKTRYWHRLRRQDSFLGTLAMVAQLPAETVALLVAVRLPL